MSHMDMEYFTVKEFAEKMRVTERTVYRWIKLTVLKASQVVKGGEYRIPISEYERIQAK
jgi:excisionase family DNA binding protein